jgi:DUF4097 and DUF4098 domain-containing protein YvlB
MKTIPFIALIAGGVLLIAGCSRGSYQHGFSGPGQVFPGTHQTNSFAVSPGGTLVIEVDSGNIHIETADTDRATFEVERSARAETREDADEILAHHQITTELENNTLTLKAGLDEEWRRRSERRAGIYAEYRLTIPKQFHIEAKTAAGRIKVGPLEGNLDAHSSGGDITLASIQGSTSARTLSGNIQIESATGAAELDTSGGNINVGRIDGSLDANTLSGSIRIDEVTGNVLAKTSGGNIVLDTAGANADLHTLSGSIRLGNVAGSLKAKTSGGNIQLDSAGRDAHLETLSGSIRAASVMGVLVARTSGGNISLDELHDTFEARTLSGSITAHLKQQPNSSCSLHTSGGTIKLHLPGDVAVDIDASVRGGRIISELPITVQGEISRQSIQGKLNGGGPILRLHSLSGNIHLEKI